LLACLLPLGAGRCVRDAAGSDPIEEIKRGGELVFLTRNAPTTYYEGRDELMGFEFELATAFAASLGVKARFVVLDSTADILEGIDDNLGHIAAAGLTRTQERETRFTFGPDYYQVRQMVVCSREQALPENAGELIERSLVVGADSAYEERLRQLQLEYPALTWTVSLDLETEQLMYQVWLGDIDCTLVDSLILELNRRYYPELRVAFRISEPEPLAWAVAPRYTALVALLEDWFAKEETHYLIDWLYERYFGYVEIFDYFDVRVFKNRIEERLPQFQEAFQAAGERYGCRWTLLAAQAYQESHWDTEALSPTGVRGIMMLTKQTAAQLGVDRLDPAASIRGGASYLADIRARLPAEIAEPDRIWIALAAYNVGFGHVLDARDLAREQGMDENLWSSLQETLPLLSLQKYYKKAPHGYARGREQVRYVQRIRNFLDILERHLGEHRAAADVAADTSGGRTD